MLNFIEKDLTPPLYRFYNEDDELKKFYLPILEASPYSMVYRPGPCPKSLLFNNLSNQSYLLD